jgi:hypothetical protein
MQTTSIDRPVSVIALARRPPVGFKQSADPPIRKQLMAPGISSARPEP